MDVSARFYSAVSCGYYPARGPKRFGSIQYLMDELKAWSTNLDLVDTKLPYVEDALPVYLASISSRNGVYVVVLWVEVPTTSSKNVASIQANAKVGAATTVENAIVPGTIPGFPCYFVVLPQANTVVSLRLDNSVMGLKQFQGFMESFLSTASSAVRVDAADQTAIVSYADELGTEHEDVRARFALHLIRHGEQSDFIKQNAHRVRKIVRVRTLQSARPSDRNFWQELVDEIGFTQRPAQNLSTRLKYEMAVTAEPGQINQLVDDNVDAVDQAKNDFGFILEGDSTTIHWLSNSIASLDLELNLAQEGGMISPVQLLSRMVARKEQLLEAFGYEPN